MPRKNIKATEGSARFYTKGEAKHRKKAALARRDGPKCRYCGQVFPLDELTLDHVIPRAKGGSSELNNLVLACAPHNRAKGTESFKAFAGVPFEHGPGNVTGVKFPRKTKRARRRA